jgi:hypothetical protein
MWPVVATGNRTTVEVLELEHCAAERRAVYSSSTILPSFDPAAKRS